MLLSQQKKAIAKLQHYKVGALFMEPGTGKTKAALNLVLSTNPDYVLWITPFQTKKNLRSEINKWSDLDCDIVGVESLQNSDTLYFDLLDKLQEAKNPFILVDESLKIKNYEAKRTKRVLHMSQFAKYKLVLNGTPLSRDLLDLWPQMEFLSPNILQMNMFQFKNTFCEYKKCTYLKGYRSRSKEWIVRYHNLDYLYKLIEPYVFECDLQLDINKQFIEIKYRLTEEELEEHDRIKDEILSDEWLMAKPNFFLQITQKLQHNYSRSPEKFRFVKDILKNNDPSEVLIFAKYIDTQNALKEAFPNIKILSYQKHSFGLNLQNYNCIVFFDKIWDYALREQAERRIYRTGQKKDCIFYDLTANVGLDGMIDANIIKKANMLQEFKKLSLEEFKKVA